MLMYGGDELIPIGYTNSGFILAIDSRKWTFKHFCTLGGGAVS